MFKGICKHCGLCKDMDEIEKTVEFRLCINCKIYETTDDINVIRKLKRN